MNVAVVFGGSGFIGTHFSRYLILENGFDLVYLADIKPVCETRCYGELEELIKKGQVKYVSSDVREAIDLEITGVTLIANFAAVHREPGHIDSEYFETNLLGAENVCDWASRIECNNIIFTSSIAPYGPTEDKKKEIDLPVPISPYGASKLVAEKIHLSWAKEDSRRKLVIVRPGVVFGPREGGNVTRLVQAIRKGYFFYMGNQDTRKAGVYVKELCHALIWVNQHVNKSESESVVLFNMTFNPGPSVQEYVEDIQKVLGLKRTVYAMPFWIVYNSSFLLTSIGKLLKKEHPFSPVRVRKLVRSNNIVPGWLQDHGYEYKYSLYSALMDWRDECPNEWGLR